MFLPNVKIYFGDKLFCPFRNSETDQEDIPCEKPTAENIAETASVKHDQVTQEEPVDVVRTNLSLKCFETMFYLWQ